MTDIQRFERVIDAPPDVVFDAFTSPGGQEAFYGDDDPRWVVESSCDLRVGGLWTITFGPGPPELFRHRHRFDVIDPPRRLALVTTEFRPDGSRLDFATEFTFSDQGGRTLMVMTQTGLPTVELREEHVRGLPDAFGQFERVVRLRRAPR